METLQRLQPLDVLFAVLWAGIVGWGLQTGFVRQLGMLVAVYGAALLSGSLYRQAGETLSLAFGREGLAIFEFIGYVFLFFLTFGVVGLIIWRTYPASRIGRHFGTENVLGAVVGSIWGVLFLIAILTILRFYVVVPWHDQEASQRAVLGQVQRAQVAPVLEVVASPLWQIMVPWFPAPVPAVL
jgi:Colicin V production protein